MVQVPEQYETPQGETEQLAYVTPEEMEMLKEQGGSGEMTPYGIPSFRPSGGQRATHSGKKETKAERKQGMSSTGTLKSRNQKEYFQNVDRWASRMQDYNKKNTNMGDQGRQGGYGGGGGGGSQYRTGSAHGDADAARGGGGGGGGFGAVGAPVLTPEQIEAQRKARAKMGGLWCR